MQLHFDFTESATRASILSQLEAYLEADEAARERAAEATARIDVPDRHHANLAAIQATIAGLDVSARVRADMRAIYELLTHAEATVHETTVAAAHFHEVGRAAGIRNVATICVAIDALDPERITATPVQAGSGTVECAHGTMPVPAPATAVILDEGVPTCEERLEGERVSPTSAAIIRHFVDVFDGSAPVAARTYFLGPVPEHPHAQGHGSGHEHGHDHGVVAAHGHERSHEHTHEHAHDEGSASGHAHEHEHTHAHAHEHEPEAHVAAHVEPFQASAEQHEKLTHLQAILRDLGYVAVAFSGGVDSSLLLDVAYEVLGDNVVAITNSSELYPQRENDLALRFCRERGIRQLAMAVDPFQVSGFADNPENRCYLCKQDLFAQMVALVQEDAAAQGLSSDDVHLVEGSNATDRGDYRPGAQAVREAGVRSPLDEADLTKQDIRDLSRERGLATWNKPSFACLASRFVYGQPITAALLSAVDRAEQLVIDQGFSQVRVRVHDGGQLARVEVPSEEVDRALHVLRYHGVADELHALGFKHVSLDVDGYRTGSMNSLALSSRFFG